MDAAKHERAMLSKVGDLAGLLGDLAGTQVGENAHRVRLRAEEIQRECESHWQQFVAAKKPDSGLEAAAWDCVQWIESVELGDRSPLERSILGRLQRAITP